METTEISMSWLLLGANGQLGRSLQDVLSSSGVSYTAAGKDDIDITDLNSVRVGVKHSKPSVIVNMAAWTDVDGAESHQEEAFLINATGAKYVAEVSAEYELPLVHISTDYVFNGQASSPYLVQDITNPLSVYGASKLKGEELVKVAHPTGSWIVRTAWLYSQYGKNFARTIARKGLAGENLSVVNDAIGQPTSSLALSRQIVSLVAARPRAGVFHGTNSGAATWFDFATAIIDPIKNHGLITPVDSTVFPSIAIRPKYSVLDHTEWATCGMTPMPHWKESLDEIHGNLIESVEE